MGRNSIGSTTANSFNRPNNNMNRTGEDSWGEQEKKKNPFCTAREYAQSGDAIEDDAEDDDEQHYPHHPSNDYSYNNNDSYHHQQQQQNASKIRGPNISAGLKRKFQPPKVDARPNNKDRGRPNKGGLMKRIGGGGGTTSRPSSSHSRSGNDNNDDDELPEALRGLDKELIEKIQNEIVDSGESITFHDIAGLADAKQTVLELVCWPMKRPDLFTGLRRGPNGLLLFGPPGTGKTLIGKAIAHESGATFFSISSSSLTSKWIGEGEKLVRTLFAVAAYREPAVVFIDEIDSLLTQRKADENEASRRIKTEFLVQLDGTGTSGRGRVLVIGATNRPHELDDAARRRFVKRLYIPLPEAPDREILLRTLLEKNSNVVNNREMKKLSVDTEGFSGADLKALCTDAALGPIRQLGARALDVAPGDVPPISYRHFRQALRGMNPSVAQADLDVYLEWNKTYGSKSLVGDGDDMGTEDDDDDEEDESDEER
uniref:AAA+ ATPase domain-containing protein n=1 Tax=Ditylum brightwellii TaxID=49249 RepID=A0A7S1YZE4_9STRA|mmetsp:Transcript_20761/g.30849  ORF Transcript_20761/g.30849 Transcript_20761/m.30849 type:complete len:485 (+) Transcript_20761:339-1793(+)